MKSSIVSEATKLTMTKVLTMTIATITAMILSRTRTLEEYGTYSQLLLSINIVTSITMIGLPNSLNYFLARSRNKEESEQFLSVYFTISTILSLLSGLILVISVPFLISYYSNPLLRMFLFFLAVYPWTKIILTSLDHILIIYKKSSTLLIFKSMNNFLLLILLIIVEFLNLGFFNYMILFIIMEIIFTIAVYVIVKNITGRIRFYINFSIISQVLKFSVPIGLASVIGVLSVQIDKLIIGMIYTTEDLAIYTNAARALPFTIIAASLTAVLMPHLVKLLKANRITDSIKLWSDANIISYAIISFFAFNLVVFAPDVLTLLYSEKYLPGVNVFRVYSVVLLLRFTYFGIILNSIGKTKHIMYGSLFSLLLNVGLSFLLYKVFGFVGPAIATLISLSSVALYQLVVTSKILNVKFKNILPWSHIIQTTMINLGLGTFFAYVHKYHFQNISSVYYSLGKSIIFASIWGIVYILIMKKRVFLSWNNLKNVNTSNIESLGNEVNYEKNG